MTREDIGGLVTAWVPRLGLRHWDITIAPDVPSDEDTDAQMGSAGAYDRATLFLGVDFEEWDADKAERVVVHELLHLVTRDLEATGEATHALLDRPARKLADARFEHELEGVVDRVAVALVAIARHSIPEGFPC